MKKIVTLTVIILLFVSCGGKEDKNEKLYREHLSKGKSYLTQGNYQSAEKEFKSALKYKSTSEAKYGLAIASTLSINDLVVMIVRTMGQGASYFSLSEGEGERMMKLVEEVIRGFKEKYDIASETWEEVLKIPNPGFSIKELPVYFGTKPVLLFKNKLSQPEALFFASFVFLTDSILNLFYSQSLTADILGAYLFYKNNGGTRGFYLSRLLAYILTENPDFLTTAHPDAWEIAGKRMKEGIDTFTKLFSEEFNTDSISFKKGTLAIKYYNSSPPITDPTFTSKDFNIPQFPDEITLAFNKDVKIAIENGPLQIISTYLALILNFILPSLESMLGNYADLLSNLLDPQSLYTALSIFIPAETIYFNLSDFFANPSSMRYWLPVTAGINNIYENHLVMEWECSNLDSHGYPPGPAGLACDKNAELTDSPHFSGANQIPADGIEARGPYLLIPDPSLNNLLYLNGGKVSDSLPDEIKKADLLTFNAVLNYILDNILSTVEY